MSYRLLRVSALSGLAANYTLDDGDLFHMTTGTADVALSSQKVTADQYATWVMTKWSNALWLSAGPRDGRIAFNDANTKTYLTKTVGQPITAAMMGGSNEYSALEELTVDGSLSANDDLYVGQYMYHGHDTDTYIRFADDFYRLHVGGVQMFDITEDASQDKIVVNESCANEDNLTGS